LYSGTLRTYFIKAKLQPMYCAAQVKSLNVCTAKVFWEKKRNILSKLWCRKPSPEHGLVIQYLITCGFNVASILTENKSLLCWTSVLVFLE